MCVYFLVVWTNSLSLQSVFRLDVPCNHSYMQVYKARDVGVNSFVLFPKVPDALKVFDEYIELFVTTSNCASKMTCPVCSSRLLQEMRHTMTMVWFRGQFACSRISSLIL